ncbi:MAG: DUF1015 domain-containing protein [Synergistaceae bacterium]|nr:DUF1015 domain-containing protein [Synergistaceae bacterium]
MTNDDAEKIKQINSSMNEYLEKNIFTEYKNSYIYVERVLLDGSIRRGLVGVIDLEEYDFKPGSNSKIRATEETVSERIPSRKKIRENAPIELSHVILLCDDYSREIIEPLTLEKNKLKKLYDFDLMLGSKNIKGWLVEGKEAGDLSRRIENYERQKSQELSVIYAIGDGNHSLAAAKTCYEAGLTSRYAMVELENIYDDSVKFEPIHRVVKNIDVDKFLSEIQNSICVKDSNDAKNFWPINFYSRDKNGVINIDKTLGTSALIVLQNYLDEKIKSENFEIDYIHDTDSLKKLSESKNSLGLEMPPFDENAKRDFFKIISQNGVMPRKTFSMGHAQEKRFYLEARKIR